MDLSSTAWEGGIHRSWDQLSEDPVSGKLVDSSVCKLQRSNAGAIGGTIRRGMIRYLYIVVDRSRSMHQQDFDFRPSRAGATQELLTKFITSFFSENPIAQLGIIVMRDGRAQKLTDLSGNKRIHLEAITKEGPNCQGEASLQNALELSLGLLNEIPGYGHREVLIIFGSLTTRDPGDIFETAEKLRRARIHVSVIELSVELFVLRSISEITNGTFRVGGSLDHCHKLLCEYLIPPPSSRVGETFSEGELVEMGFPRREAASSSSSCLGYACGQLLFLIGAYVCPRCETRAAEVRMLFHY